MEAAGCVWIIEGLISVETRRFFELNFILK